MNRFRMIGAALLVAVAASTLAGCQSRPELKQVAPDAAEQPINTPEAAEQLKHAHER